MVYDVIVSGLGPAGSSFLKRLAGSGLRVLALEKEEFPRRKPCAGGLTVKAYKLLDSLFPGLEKAVRLSVKEIELHHKDQTSSILAPSVLTYLTDRRELDNFLFESLPHREFDLHTKETCLAVERLSDGCLEVKTDKDTYSCRVLVVAEGVNSRISSHFKLKREIGFTYETEVEFKCSSKIIIDFSRFTWGYYWAFPKGDFVSTGVGEFRSRELFKRLKELLKNFNSKHGFRGRILGERGFPIPAGKRNNDVYRDRILFLGDSGGLVDPLTGEGIYYAARSGVIASEVVKSAFAKGDFSKLSIYKTWIDGELGEEFKWARIVGRLFFPLRGVNFFLLKRSRELSLLAARLLSGDISYKEGFFSYLKVVPKALIKI